MDYKEKIAMQTYYSNKKYKKCKPQYKEADGFLRIGNKTNINRLNQIKV